MRRSEPVPLSAQSCGFWQRNVAVLNYSFASVCNGFSYNNLDVTLNGQHFGAVDEKVVTLSAHVRFRRNDVVFATLKEPLSSALSPLRPIRAEYTIETNTGTLDVARVLDRSLVFYNGTRTVGNVSTSVGQLVQGALCGGADWSMDCEPNVCLIVMYTGAWYAQHRDAAPLCQVVYWLVALGLPLLAILACAVVVCVRMRKK